MKNTFTILVYLRKSKQKLDGTQPIYFRVTVNGKRSEFSAKRSVHEEKWNSAKGRVKGTSENTRALNMYLETVHQKLYDAYQDVVASNKPVSAKAVTDIFFGKGEAKKTLLEVFKLHNEGIESRIGDDYAASTVTKYKTTYKHLQSFIRFKYKTDDVSLHDISLLTIKSFESYLRTELGIGVNCTNKYLTHFNKVVNLAVSNEWIDRNPCLSHKMRNKAVVKDYLLEHEIQLLIDAEIEDELLEQVRDIFVFCCLTGLAYIDVKRLTADAIQLGVDGNKWLYTRRKKTGSKTNIPLFPHALHIIEKYSCHPEVLRDDVLLPVLSNQKMNTILKEVAIVVGVNKHLTMHMARHTFATYTLTKGVSIESVSSMLGHKSLVTTQIYAKIIDAKVAEDVASMFADTPR